MLSTEHPAQLAQHTSTLRKSACRTARGAFPRGHQQAGDERKKNYLDGFTLIEVLTALAIASVLIAGMAALFVGGGHVLSVLAERRDAKLEKAVIALEKIAIEIQRSRVYPDVPLEGRRDSISIPVLVNFEDEEPLADFKLGQIQSRTMGGSFGFINMKYMFDASRNAIVKQTPSQNAEVLLEDVEHVEFQYAVGEPGRSWKWVNSTPEDDMSKSMGAMKIRVEFDPEMFHYTVPAVERTFLILRRHPLSVPKVEVVK